MRIDPGGFGRAIAELSTDTTLRGTRGWHQQLASLHKRQRAAKKALRVAGAGGGRVGGWGGGFRRSTMPSPGAKSPRIRGIVSPGGAR